MNLQNLSYNLLEIILRNLTYKEIQAIYPLTRQMSLKIEYFVQQNLRNIHIYNLNMEYLYLKDKFQRLEQMQVCIQSINMKEVQTLLQVIPKSVTKLKIQISVDIIVQQMFYNKLSKYHNHLQSLKLVVMGTFQNNSSSINIPYLHNEFFTKMTKLKKLKIDTHGIQRSSQIQDLFFYSLFYKDEIHTQIPQITHIQFDQLMDVNQLEHTFIDQDHFQLNTVVQSFCLKQYDERIYFTYLAFQFNCLHRLNYFQQIFGRQLSKISLTQHQNSHTILDPQMLNSFIEYFSNLTTLQLNIYNLSYEIPNYQLDDISSKLKLSKLGLASLHAHQSHFAAMLSYLDLQSITLDFTHIDDNCLDILSQFTNIKELHIRGCRQLTKGGLINFISKQRQLTSLDIRGVSGFSKKAFRQLLQSCILKKLSISDNKIDNKLMLQLFERYRFSLTHLNIGELLSNQNLTNDVFELIWSKNIRLINLESLQIQMAKKNGFKICTLTHILQICPNLRILSVKIYQKFEYFLDILISAEILQKRLEKIVISGYDIQLDNHLIDKAQRLRNCMKHLTNITINSEFTDVYDIFKKTTGERKIRIIMLQQQEQYLI